MAATGIHLTDLVLEVIRPALRDLAAPKFKLDPRHVVPHTHEAEQLLALTCGIESGWGRHLRQRTISGPGPALGAFQMEPATHADILGNFLATRDSLERAVKATGRVRNLHERHLTYNLRYAATMTRIHYFRVPKGLPKMGDHIALGAYWKKYYNTPRGAGTVEKAQTIALAMLTSRAGRELWG